MEFSEKLESSNEKKGLSSKKPSRWPARALSLISLRNNDFFLKKKNNEILRFKKLIFASSNKEPPN